MTKLGSLFLFCFVPSCLLALGLIFILGLSTMVLAETTLPVRYDLRVRIEPAQGAINVGGKILVPITDPGAKTLSFGLHETFAIKTLSVNRQATKFSYRSIQATPLNPATRNVLVDLPAKVTDRLEISIEYGGRLKEIPEFGTYPDQKQAMDDQINSRLVELANYSSWYPQFFAYGRPIEIALEVSLPRGWNAICSGRREDETVKGERVITRWTSSRDADILIAAAPNYKQKVLRLPAGDIEIYYTQLPEKFVAEEGQQIADVLNLFSEHLGPTIIPSGTVKHVFSPKREGQGRAGIARPGMIVTSEGRVLEQLAKDPNFSLFQDVAHEIAHFWWNFGSGQGDWINEAFAEYSSAMAVKMILSEQQFDSILEGYRGEVEGLPPDALPLAKVPFDGSEFVIRYYKGALMLDSFRHDLGDDRFVAGARDFFQTYKGQAIGTSEFRSFWRRELGEDKELMDVWLDSSGGMPQLPKVGPPG